MAITQNTYTGNGSTTNYSFTFPYLETTDIKASINGTPTTAFSLANATTVSFNTAPANGASIRIYRETDDAALAATFYPGSAIRSQDLNDNYTQVLYKTQETTNYAVRDTGNVNLTAQYTFANPVSGQTPTSNNHLATKSYVDDVRTYVDTVAFSSGNLTIGNKGSITVNSSANWSINSGAIAYSNLQNVSTTDRILGRSSSGSGVVEEIICTSAGRALLDDVDSSAQLQTLNALPNYSTTTTSVSKSLANRERCTVTAPTLTITLPSSPQVGWEVAVVTGGAFTDTVIARNGSNIMGLAEDITIDKGNVAVTLFYVNTTLGWRII